MGDNRQSEQKREGATTSDTSTAGAQAGDQSSETSVSSQQQERRGRFLGRLRKRRSTGSTEQPGVSTEQPAKKSKIGLLGIVITALVGFVFGIGANQVTDFVKRADDCYDALSQYEVGVASNFGELSYTAHDQKATDDQKNAANTQYNTLIVLPHVKIKNKCPINDKSEYLNSGDVNHFNATWTDLTDNCYAANECSYDNASSYTLAASNSAAKLLEETHVVSQWGLVRRAKYELTHLY